MIGKYTHLRTKRRFRKRKKQVVGLSQNANKQIDRHIFRRWHNFRGSGRFTFTWVGFVIILIIAVAIQTRALGRYYLVPQPVAGGVYTEGVVGVFSNINPIYIANDVDASVSKLVFSSLFDYDSSNQLVNDLAQSYEVDEKGVNYTVHLKPNIMWHDGYPLTSDDVIFTYSTIKNPDAKSPLRVSWADVKVTKVDELTVRFTLPTTYSPFLHSLTNGIIPKHILQDVPVFELRSVVFNAKSPIGSGPFKWKDITVNKSSNSSQLDIIQLENFDEYYLGKPELDGITIKIYEDKDALYKALEKNQVIGAAGLSMTDQDIPSKYETNSLVVMSANMLFLKTTNEVVSNTRVRQALIKATDVPSLIEKVGYPVMSVKEPILSGQVGYSQEYQQFTFNREEAVALLDTAGWKKVGNEQFRQKNGKSLILNLVYENNSDFSKIANALQKQWADVGVSLAIDVNQGEDYTSEFVNSHDYDILLHGINIGSDPDVYAYWHSSQADIKNKTHLNFSEYNSSIADQSLEDGRSRSDPELRAIKYKPFLNAWKNDVPAIGLYQPRYLYVFNQHVYGLGDSIRLNSPSDRFNNVHNWMINTAREPEA